MTSVCRGLCPAQRVNQQKQGPDATTIREDQQQVDVNGSTCRGPPGGGLLVDQASVIRALKASS